MNNEQQILSPIGGNKLVGKPEWELGPAITIRKTSGAINSFAQELMDIKDGDSVLMSKKDGILYICVLPMDSKLVGFVAKKYSNASSLRYRSLPLVIKYEIKAGIYQLTGEILHDSTRSIDWYKLTYCNES
jgi:hypothetical protein